MANGQKALLENAANKILGNMPIESMHSATFDPITILMIISILISFVRMIQECKKNSANEVKGMIRNLDDDNDRKVRDEVRRMLGRRNYRNYGKELVKAILVFGKEEPEADLEELVCLDM